MDGTDLPHAQGTPLLELPAIRTLYLTGSTSGQLANLMRLVDSSARYPGADLAAQSLALITTDAVPYLLEAKKVHSSTLEAVSYFYTLRTGAASISNDKRLSDEDRRRLLTGSHAFALRGQALAENSWATPSAPGVSNGQWQPRRDSRMGDIAKLWDTFASPPWSLGS